MRPGDHRGCRQHPGAPIGTFAEVNRYHGPETRDLNSGVFQLDQEPQQAHLAFYRRTLLQRERRPTGTLNAMPSDSHSRLTTPLLARADA